MDRFSPRAIASALYPRYSDLMHRVNCNGMLTEWVARYEPIQRFNHRFELYRHIQDHYVSTKPIDYLEFGVYQGASIREWTQIHQNPESRFYGFDSFQGLPEDSATWGEKGRFNVNGVIPDVADPRCSFVAGWFHETVPSFLQTTVLNRQVVMNVDSDLYPSVLYPLTTLDSHLGQGAIIIFDEFSIADHEFRAWIDYTSAYRRTYEVVGGAGKRGIEQMAVVLTN